MDPASFAASVVTLLAAASATSEFVYNFILDIDDVPDEIRSQAVKLQCLNSILSMLMYLYKQNEKDPDFQLDPFLRDHLESFKDEVGILEERLKASSARLEGSRKQRLWARLKWLSSDRELRKFYNKLDEWTKIFMTAVNITQLKLLKRVDQSIHNHLLPAPVCAHQQHQSVNPRVQIVARANKMVLPARVRTQLARSVKLVGARVQHWYINNTKAWMPDVRTGPAIIRVWTDDGKTSYTTVSAKKGMCIASTMRGQQIFSKRMTFMLSYLLDGAKLSISCSFAAYGMLQVSAPAYQACERGDWPMLRNQLENKHIGISDTTGYGDTLLHVAARHDHLDLVTALLQEGADVDAENDFGETPLQAAVNYTCSYATLSQLLTAGADINHQDITGRSALHMPFNASVQALIEFHYDDLDTTAQDSDGMNIAHHVSRSKSSSPADLDRCYPKSLATLDNEGKSLLHHACQRGNLDIVERLLGERDEALACRDYHGRTLMHYATESSRCAETIDILLREGFGIHEKDCRDRTVMHHAASKGILKAVEKLLDLGAAVDLEALDKDGRTPLQLAAWCSSHAVVDFLRSHCGAEQADDLPEERVVWHEKEKKVTDEVAGFDLKSWLIMFMVVGSMTRWLLFRS